jgi:GAF domain-containing protein
MPLLEHLGRTVEEVIEVVPACLGLSVVRIDQTDSCTIAASDEKVAVLDAVQYLDGGPGVEAAVRRQWGATTTASLDDRWPLYAAASLRAGVRTTLTLPVTDHEVALGAVRVYAGREDAFDRREERVARLVDGGEAVDLVLGSATTLTTRRLAERSPLSLRAQGSLNRAIGALTLHLDTDVTTAHERLVDAAQRAGITVERLAQTVVDLHD